MAWLKRHDVPAKARLSLSKTCPRSNVSVIISEYLTITELQRTIRRHYRGQVPNLITISSDLVHWKHALIVPVNRFTAENLGMVQISSRPLAVVSMPPTLYNGILFVGLTQFVVRPSFGREIRMPFQNWYVRVETLLKILPLWLTGSCLIFVYWQMSGKNQCCLSIFNCEL